MTESTNYILFAIVIMLFAMVLELISTDLGFLVVIFALVGLGFSLYGLFGKAIAEAVAESRDQQ